MNTLRWSSEAIESELKKHSIWYTKLDFPKDCFVLSANHRESDIWKLDIYKHGNIYMQSLSSQIPVHFFTTQASDTLKILDACAAPGWKTSQLSALYPDAEIYAFEPNKIRYEKMQHNLGKLWCTNVTAIHDEIRNIWEHVQGKSCFDIVLIDAPCSSEGSISLHNNKFLESWDISHIKKNYKRQKYIVSDILPYLKTWWELIYSTCTLAPEENEALVHYALCNYPELNLENIDFSENKYIKTSNALKNFGNMVFKREISKKALRVMPSEYSEWFFIAKFRKWTDL